MALLSQKSNEGPMEQAGDMAQGASSGGDQAAKRGADIALLAAAASVVLSWYQFYGQQNRSHGIFIGLWPPTILAFASYLQQKSILDKLENSLVGRSGMDSLRRLLE